MRSKFLMFTLVSGVVLCAGAASADQVASGNNFTVNSTVGTCTANAECKITLRLEAKGDFHVNKEYPYKFKMNAAPAGVTYPTDTFSKANGDFTLDASNEKVGTMTLKFKSANKGAVSISGVFKLSVCSAQNCQMETANVTVPVTVH